MQNGDFSPKKIFLIILEHPVINASAMPCQKLNCPLLNISMGLHFWKNFAKYNLCKKYISIIWVRRRWETIARQDLLLLCAAGCPLINFFFFFENSFESLVYFANILYMTFKYYFRYFWKVILYIWFIFVQVQA